MRKRFRIIVPILIIMMLWTTVVPVFGETWVFESSGKGQNPFTPRGYLIDLGDDNQQWLSSQYDNSGEVISYSGSSNGLDYVDADENYKIYAMTDRNPTPGKNFLTAWKNGVRISGFGDMAGTPGRGEAVDPSGVGTCWVIPMEGFTLEPGCYYEFAFRRGMQANNGVTLVLSEDGRGYIKNPETSEEKAKYNRDKNEEYEFIASYEKNEDDEGETQFFNFHFVPMRFSVQTYADMSIWKEASDGASEFLDSVTDADYETGRYRRKNINNLKDMLSSFEAEAEDSVRKQLQNASNDRQREMADELNQMLEKARTERAPEADMSKLEAKISEGEKLYDKVSGNVGKEYGQYGADEVKNLKDELETARELNKFDPQSDIDDEVEMLDQAIIEVKASIVRDAVRIFHDKATGIYVIVPSGTLPAEIGLIVRRLDEQDADYRKMKEQLGQEAITRMYDIGFYQNDSEVTPTGEVEVQIPVPDEMNGLATVVYSSDEDGNLNPLLAAGANGMKIFKTKTLGNFVIEAREKLSKTPPQKGGKSAGKVTVLKKVKKTSGKKADQYKNKDKKDKIDKKDKLKDDKNENQNKERELKKDKKKKEDYKDPKDRKANKELENTDFDSNITKDTDSKHMIFAAVAIAIFGCFAGAMSIIARRKS